MIVQGRSREQVQRCRLGSFNMEVLSGPEVRCMCRCRCWPSFLSWCSSSCFPCACPLSSSSKMHADAAFSSSAAHVVPPPHSYSLLLIVLLLPAIMLHSPLHHSSPTFWTHHHRAHDVVCGVVVRRRTEYLLNPSLATLLS